VVGTVGTDGTDGTDGGGVEVTVGTDVGARLGTFLVPLERLWGVVGIKVGLVPTPPVWFKGVGTPPVWFKVGVGTPLLFKELTVLDRE